MTENPSVFSAAVDLAVEGVDVRLLCTSGTPSAMEIDAAARLAAAGWRVAVRADFDHAGLNHVAAVLKGVPHARPWRMSSDDYVASLSATQHGPERLDPVRVPESPWDPGLSIAIRERGIAAFEEALLPLLLHDLRLGSPGTLLTVCRPACR